MKRILVTGAAGFIGANLSHRLLDRGDQVVGLDNFNSYYDPSLKRARAEPLAAKDGFDLVDAAHRVRGGAHLEALELEELAEGGADALLVVHDEDATVHGMFL